MALERLFSALYNLRKPRVKAILDDMLAEERLSRSDLLVRQKVRLVRLFQHAYNTTSYYRELFDRSGIAMRIGRGDVDLADVPVLTKAVLREQGRQLISNARMREALIEGRTAGSTGVPVTYYYERETLDHMMAAARRYYMWSGWRPGERIMHFWGARQDLTHVGSIKRCLGEWYSQEKTIDASQFDHDTLRAWGDKLMRFSPVLLQGYPSVITRFGQFLREEGSTPPRLKGIYCTAEVLYPWQRQLLEEVFQCKVFNQYGSREVIAIACECAHGSMHLFTDTAYVETLPDNEVAGAAGRLIVTSLTNWAMPFIRYELGDIGALKDGYCACGSQFPMMTTEICRSNDIICTPSGKDIYPSYFHHVLDGIAGIASFQFRQITDECLLLLVEQDGRNPNLQSQLSELGQRIKRDLDPGMQLEAQIVDQIERSKAGKHRFVISELGVRSADSGSQV